MKAIEKDFNNKLTKKDYFLYLINRNMFILVSPIIILALIVVFIFMVNKDGFQFSDILYLLPILLFALSYIQMNNSINKALKINAETKKLKVVLEENKYKEITNNGETSLEYDKFYSYYENKNYFYLYVDKINALILPKREFNDEELAYIDEILSKKIIRVKLLNMKTILGLIFSVSLIICMIVLVVSMI